MTRGLGKKVGVFGHAGIKNLGDEALIAAVIQNIRKKIPGAEVVAFSINPADTRQRHGIQAFPIRQSGEPSTAPEASSPSLAGRSQGSADGFRALLKGIPGLRSTVILLRKSAGIVKGLFLEPKFLFSAYRNLKDVDLLLIAGSQQLSDGYGGAWGFPFTLYKWMLLAKLTGTKVAILSVGAGPINRPLSKFFFRRVLQRVDYRSYRDEVSSELIRSLEIPGNHPVFPDLVYSLDFPRARPMPPTGSQVVVGANPVPFFDDGYWPTSDPERYQDYVLKNAKFAEWLAKSGHAVLFFPTQVRADVRTINDIRKTMNGYGQSPNILAGQTIETIEDLVSEISQADLIVANRYHGILISLVLNKPVLAIAYHEKSRALLTQVGQDDYVLNIADFKTEDLIERLQAMEANASAIKKQIAERMQPLRDALSLQYDEVFSLIGV